jgi:hypothetical protein
MKIVETANECPRQPGTPVMAGNARKARRPSGRPPWKVFANLHLRAGPSRRRALPGEAGRFRNAGSRCVGFDRSWRLVLTRSAMIGRSFQSVKRPTSWIKSSSAVWLVKRMLHAPQDSGTKKTIADS